jgi:hypothetical protein
MKGMVNMLIAAGIAAPAKFRIEFTNIQDAYALLSPLKLSYLTLNNNYRLQRRRKKYASIRKEILILRITEPSSFFYIVWIFSHNASMVT